MQHIEQFKSNILSITHGNINVRILKKESVIFILIGEEHYIMDDLYKNNISMFDDLQNAIVTFIRNNNVHLFLEKREYDELEYETYNKFMRENLNLEFTNTKTVSILEALAENLEPEYFTKFDIRNKINPLFNRSISDVLNIICNMYHLMENGPDPSISDTNYGINDMIIKFIEDHFIEPMVIYLLKNKELYESLGFQDIHKYILDEILNQFRNLINFNIYMLNNLQQNIEVDNKYYDILETIIFKLPALITDLNLFGLIFNKNGTNVIYAGEAHNANVYKFLTESYSFVEI